MKLLLHKIILAIITTSQVVIGAKILCVFPFPSYSHQKPFVNICKTLSNRGHQVTLITTHPFRDKNLTNLTEIDISFLYEFVRQRKVEKIYSNDRYLITTIYEKEKLHTTFNNEILRSKQVQELIANEDESFNIILVEAHCRVMFAFGEKYNAPIIGK